MGDGAPLFDILLVRAMPTPCMLCIQSLNQESNGICAPNICARSLTARNPP